MYLIRDQNSLFTLGQISDKPALTHTMVGSTDVLDRLTEDILSSIFMQLKTKTTQLQLPEIFVVPNENRRHSRLEK